MTNSTVPSKSLDNIMKDIILESEVNRKSLFMRGLSEGYTEQEISQYWDNWLVTVRERFLNVERTRILNGNISSTCKHS